MGGLLRELDEAGKVEVDDEGDGHHNGEWGVYICGEAQGLIKKF